MNPLAKKLFKLSSIGLLALLASQSYAAGYKLVFQASSTLADGGDAAVVEDAGTNWYNSAGLVDIPQQLVAGGYGIWAHTKFDGSVIAPPTNRFLPRQFLIPYAFIGEGSASSKSFAKLPLLHYAYPINHNWALGISVVPAWGFTEDYGRNDSLLRYNLQRVYTKSMDIAPSIAFRINCHWSIGLGPDFHYLSLQNRLAVRTAGPMAPIVLGTPFDSNQRFTADNWDYGGHIGVLYSADERTRVGLNYRTQIATKLDGRSTFTLDHVTQFNNHKFTFRFTIPPTTTLSVYHAMNPKWALMGSLLYDQWSFVKRYHARNVVTPPVQMGGAGLISSVYIPQHMRNVFDLYVGTQYWVMDNLMLRGNVKWLNDPTQAEFRTVTFPDGPKIGIDIGARYVLNRCVAFDVSYGHVWVAEGKIHDVNPITQATAVGHSITDLNTLGAQIVWTI